MALTDVIAAQQYLADNPQNRGFSLLNGKILSSGVTAIAVTSNGGGLVRGNHSFADSPVTNPWTAMPDGGFPFSFGQAVNTPAIGAGFTNIINVVVPNGYDGVINNISNFYNGAGFNQGSGQFVWRILVNGQAVRNYDNILIFLGPNGTNITQIRVYSGNQIQFQVSNVSIIGALTQCTAFMGGWFYPNKQQGRNG